MKIAHILSAAILIAAMPAMAVAQTEGTPVDRAAVGPEGKMGLQVTNYAFQTLKDVVPPQKTLRLLLIAKQRALATTCAEFDVDNDRFTSAMAVALEDVTKLTKPNEANLALRTTLFAYGTMVGGELAISAYNPDSYCANGRELRDELKEDPSANILILKD